jgi:prepilin-type N-terminal cleavage/methylation domain-containing protein
MFFTRSKAGFSLVEVMVAILILTVGMLGVGYGLHVSYKIDDDSIGLLRCTEYKKDSDGNYVYKKDSDGDYIINPITKEKEREQVKTGLRDIFNDSQFRVYGTLK